MLIASMPYYKIERILTSDKDETIIHRRSLRLYTNRIVTAHREFHIEEVFDISFRDLGQGHGMLYLHTKQGVFPYTVESAVDSFVSEVKRIISEK